MASTTGLVFGEFRLDLADERLWGPGGSVRIGHKAFRVLRLLAERPGRLITKDALFETVWDGTTVSESALTSVVKELRRALGDESRTPRFIESVYGRGYRFIADVEAAAAADRSPSPVVIPDRDPGISHPEPAPPTTGEEGPPLLYVAPFESAGDAPDEPYLAIVLWEELVSALSRFRDVKLVPGAGGAVAGDCRERDYGLSVKLVPGRTGVRAFGRLSHLRSGAIVWADTLVVAADALDSDAHHFARTIAAAVLPRLHDHLINNLAEHPADLYGRYFAARRRMRGQMTYAQAREVAAEWERLIAEQPALVPAYPPLVRLYNTDFCFTGIGASGEPERRRAYELAHAAIANDPADAHLRTVKGWCHLRAYEALLAREHLDQGLTLNPLSASRLIESATAFMYLEDLERAADLLAESRRLPAVMAEAAHEEEGLLLLLREDFQAAEDQLALIRRYHPDDRVTSQPSLTGALFAMLAAAGSGKDVGIRASQWRATMIERWHEPRRPDDRRLEQWVLFQNPFQDPARRAWVARLLSVALSAG